MEGERRRRLVAIGATFTLLSFLGWSALGATEPPAPAAVGDLMITEIRDGAPGQRFVEILNHAGSNLNPSGWTLRIDGVSQDLSPLGTIPQGAYRTIGDGGADDLPLLLALGTEGASVEVHDPLGGAIDWIEYGRSGAAPDPPDGASTSRFFNGTEYEEDWSLDLTPTWRARNDGPDVSGLPLLRLNEVLYDSLSASDRFIELRYTGWGALDVSGHRVQGDTLYTVAESVVLTPERRHFVLRSGDDPAVQALLDTLAIAADNVYLYSPGGERMDMVGWSSAHPQGTSVCRVPGGRNGHGGYNDVTSVFEGWQFGCAPTPANLEIGPSATAYADLGDIVTYRLNVTNGMPFPVVVDLQASPPPSPWTVTLLGGDGVTPLPDTNANGAPDVGLTARGTPGERVPVTLVVGVPSNLPTEDFVQTVVTATEGGGASASATVTTNLYPVIELDRWADPKTIFLAGTGYQERTTLTLEVTGRGVPTDAQGAEAADIVFVLDDTSSMYGAIDALKADIGRVTDQLAENVSSLRLGLVSFKDVPPWGPYEIDVDIDLTPDIDAFKAALDAIVALNGGDLPEDADIALEVAANLSWRPGNVTRGMVLITDAETHDNLHLTSVARWAWQSRQIHTNTVAVGGVWVVPPAEIYCLVDPNTAYWMNRTAENGTGAFDVWYPQPPPPFPPLCPGSTLGDMIMAGIAGIIPGTDVAARDPDVTDPDPMVRDVLPPHIGVVPGTFLDPDTGSARPPDFATTDAFGRSILEWNVTEVRVGEVWRVSFEAESTLAGVVPTNVYGLSRASYRGWDGEPAALPFPEVNVTVLVPGLPPRNLTTHWDGAATVSLTWEEPPGPVDRYLVFKTAGDPRGFTDLSPGAAYASVAAPASSWTDPAPLAAAGETYYLLRSSDASGGNVSGTTNTAGVFAVTLAAGVTAISRPLEYFPWVDYSGAEVDSLAEHAQQFGADSGAYLDATGAWRSVPGAPDVRVELGRAYVLDATVPRLVAFTGLPGSMIRYDEGAAPGYDLAAARGLAAAVSGNDVLLNFAEAPGFSGSYEVWASPSRTGFHDGAATLLASLTPATFPATATHAGALALAAEWYYMVVPVHPTLGAGASTFSVGVWSRTYAAKDTFALPLRPSGSGAISAIADAVPGAFGLLWLLPSGRWIPHFSAMAPGSYDAAVTLATGFEIDLRAAARFAHIGW